MVKTCQSRAFLKRALLALLVFSLFPSSIPRAAEIILTSIQGEVQIFRKEKNAWEKAKGGLLLKTGDKIRTGGKSQVSTVSKEGHKILIREKTVFEISKAGPLEWEFRQESGRARLSVAKLGRGQGLKVITPTAICAVRGTEFEVAVLEDRSTLLDVFHGIVGFGDVENALSEIAVIENQRSSIQEGGVPKPPEPIPAEERGGGPQDGKKEQGKLQEDKKAEERKPRDASKPEDGDAEGVRDREKRAFKMEVQREIGLDLQRDRVESAAAFEVQTSQYEEGKTLIDAFGQRVRLEEYVTRPSPESFKFVSLNTRANRMDFVSFEIVANKPLPENISDAGNLWFSVGPSRPEFYVVRQKWTASNMRDTVTELFLDGDSRPVHFQQPVFSDSGQFLGVTNQQGFQTVFDHRYAFINGNAGAIHEIWTGGFRPRDNSAISGVFTPSGLEVTGLAWHMRPVLIEHYDPVNSAVLASFWQNTFVTSNGAGATATGKMDVQTNVPDANPFLAHFIEKHAYINFTDTNGNGRLDQGERYFDRNGNGSRDADEPFDDAVQLGLNGAKDLSRSFDPAKDTVFFSDKNRDGLDNDGNAGPDAFSVAQNPWAWQVAENFMITDLGRILDVRDQGLASFSRGGEDRNAVADAFEKVNFERVFHSSEFDGRKIDVVMSPRIFLRANVLGTQNQGKESLDNRN